MAASKYEIFLKVVELGSLTKAASALGCTQSAVSHSLNALESEANLRLLHRSRAGVSLTSDGQQLLPSIQKIVDALSQYERALDAIHGLETGCVRIGAFTSVAVHWLPGVIKTYRKDHPHTEIKMLNGDYHDITQWFAEGSIDIGFVNGDSCPPGGQYIPLTEDRLLLVLPQNHRLAGRESVSAADIAGEPFISLLESSNQDARNVLEQAGVQVDVKFTTKDDYAIIAMVEQGLGISIMPELLLKGHSAGICAVPLKGGQTRTIGLAIASHSLSSPSVQCFSQYVQHWVEENYK